MRFTVSSTESVTAGAAAGVVSTDAVGAPPVAGYRRPRRAGLKRLVGEQVFVLFGQLAAGVSHLAFAVVVARLLSPADFAAFAAFQAMYLVIRAMVSSLIAGGSLDPMWSTRARARVMRIAVRLAAVGMLLSLVVGRLLHLYQPLVWLLALSVPAAALFALDQGRLFGLLRHGRAVAGQVTGPALRMAIGIPLASGFGATGAAIATVVGGYAAALVVWPSAAERRAAETGTPTPPPSTEVSDAVTQSAATGETPTRSGAVPAAIIAFLLLSIVQNQDVMFANRLLDGADSGRFAALSTLGGAVAFATATVPFVLLPRARSGRGALGPALLVSGLLGLVPVALVAVASGPIMSAVFGDRYADAAPLAVRYVLAMAFLGIGRVLIANLCSGERWRRAAPGLVAAAVGAQVVALVIFGDSAAHLATITLLTTSSLTIAAFGLTAIDHRLRAPSAALAAAAETPQSVLFEDRSATDRAADVRPEPLTLTSVQSDGRIERVRHNRRRALRRSFTAFLILMTLTIGGLALRVLTASRSVWVDEAISIDQALMPFGDMLRDLGTGDVHPPLHGAILWIVVRVLGTEELAIRLPSIIAGTLLIPMIYAVAKEVFDRRTALVATALGVVSPFLVWYSQEARMYGFVMLFALVALWAQLRALERGRWWYWTVYAVASALMVWSHYFALVPIAAQQLIFVREWFRRRADGDSARQLATRWLVSASIAVTLALPLVPFLLYQLATNRAVSGMAGGDATVQQAGGTPGSGMSVYRVGANLVWALWGFHPDNVMTRVAALWPLLMVLALFLLGRGWSRRARWLMLMSAVPTVVFIIIGNFRDGLFEIRYFGAVVAPLLILAASWIVKSSRSARGIVLATAVVGATMVVGLVDQQLNNQNPRVYDFEGALAEVEELLEPGDTFVYGPDYLATVINYYAPDVKARFVGGDLPELGDGRRVVVLGSFLDIPSVSGRIGSYLAQLEEEASLVRRIEKGTEVRIWVYE